MAGCKCGIFQAEKYTEKSDLAASDHNYFMCFVGSFTGWKGWSIDFVFPFGTLTVLGSIPVIAGVSHLETEEYLYYLLQAAMIGCIPVILIWIGIVHYTLPSVLCTGISFLTLAGMFIFQKKRSLREFRKKLRM